MRSNLLEFINKEMLMKNYLPLQINVLPSSFGLDKTSVRVQQLVNLIRNRSMKKPTVLPFFLITIILRHTGQVCDQKTMNDGETDVNKVR